MLLYIPWQPLVQHWGLQGAMKTQELHNDKCSASSVPGDYVTSLPHLRDVISPLWETRDGEQRGWALTQVQPGGASTAGPCPKCLTLPLASISTTTALCLLCSYCFTWSFGQRRAYRFWGVIGLFCPHHRALPQALLLWTVCLLPAPWGGTIDSCGFIQVQC